MALTYTAIATVTVGSGGAASIDFTSIPGTYTDLLIKHSLRGNHADIYHAIILQFNSNTSNYSTREINGYNGTVSSTTRTTLGNGMYAGNADGSTATSSTFGSGEIYIPNYAGSNNKSVSIDVVNENNSALADTTLIAGLWSNTAAITTIKLIPFSAHGNSWLQHSTATLYGIKNTV